MSPPRSSLWAYPLKLESKPVAPAGLDALIRLQAADGSWELTPKLAAILGRSLRDVASAVSGATGPREEIERAWATALALAWLRLHAVEFGDEWRMLAAKGRTRVENSRAILPGGRTWLEEARRFLEP
jgi:hypothetical protein